MLRTLPNTVIRQAFAKIPNWLEIAIVVAICFGSSIVISVFRFISGAAFERVEITDAHLVGLLIFEPILSVASLGFLYLCGYKLWTRIQFVVSLRAIGLGVAVCFAQILGYVLLWMAASLILLLFGTHIPVAAFTVKVSLILAVAVSIINPMFEEAFLLGYLFDRLQKHSMWFLIGLATLIRVSYHLYQGWVGVIGLIPTGIVMGLVYWRTRNLMPVYLAHLVMDLTGLLGNQYIGGNG